MTVTCHKMDAPGKVHLGGGYDCSPPHTLSANAGLRKPLPGLFHGSIHNNNTHVVPRTVIYHKQLLVQEKGGGFNQSLCPQVNWESEKRSPYHNTARNTLAVKIPNVVNPPHKGPPWTIGATLFWTLRGRVFWEPKKAPGGGGTFDPPPLPEMGGEDGGSDHCPSSVAPKFWEDSFLDPKNFLRRFAPIVEKSTWDGFPWPKKTA